MIDFDAELEIRRGEIDPDFASTVQQYTYLRHELESSAVECLQQSQLQVRVDRPSPARPLQADCADSNQHVPEPLEALALATPRWAQDRELK